ncbi:hypothetical protein RB597_005999 [Gaeumannomyces tritici]
MPTIQESIQNIRDRLKDPQPEVLDALTRENPQDRHYAEKWLAYHRPPRGPSTEPAEPGEPDEGAIILLPFVEHDMHIELENLCREVKELANARPMSLESLKIREAALGDDEIIKTAHRLERLLSPRFNYLGKARKSYWKLGSILGGKMFDKYWTLGCRRRLGVMTRHLVKAQWEQLGIWNPEWGFPGRNQQDPGDFVDKWRWPWEQAEADDEAISRQRHEAIVRAVRERRNPRRGRWAPVAPRRHPGPDTSAAEAYSFLTSRPWFIYKLDLEVEVTKLERIDRGFGKIKYEGTAIWERDQLWKREGEYERLDPFAPCPWKWRHESPSPMASPTRENSPQEGSHGPNLAPHGAYTPSEAEELDMIAAPRSSQPERYWPRSRGSSPTFPDSFPPTPPPRTQFFRLGPMPDIYSVEGSKRFPMWRMHRDLIEHRLREAEGQDAKLPDLWPAPPPLSPRSRLERLGEAPEPEPGPYPGWRLFEWEKMKGEIVADMEQWVRKGRYVSAAAAGPGRSAAPSEPDAPEPVSAQDEQPPAKRARLSRPAVAAAAEARTAAPARRGGRGGRRARRSPEPGPETVLPSVETEVAVADAFESRAAARRGPSVPTLQQPTPRRGRSKRLG